MTPAPVLPRRFWTVIPLSIFAAAAVYYWSRSRHQRMFLPAVESAEVIESCTRAAYPLADCLDRIKAMGVVAVVFKPQPLSQLIDEGDILHFGRAEIEKWRVLGLVSRTIPLTANAFWIRDNRVLDLVMEAAAVDGVSVSTSSYGGYHLVQWPHALKDLALSSYDAEAVQAAVARGFVAVYAGGEDSARPFFEVGLRWLSDGSVTGFTGSAEGGPYDAVLEAAYWDVSAGPAALRRLSYASARRLMIARLSPGRGFEENLTLLRAGLKDMGRLGPLAPLPAQAPLPVPPPSPLSAVLAMALAWILGIAGPLLGARVGLLALQSCRLATLRHPIFSPPLPVAGALLAAAAMAAAAGILANGCLHVLSPIGSTGSWALWSLILSLGAGLLTLYPPRADAWVEKWTAPLTLSAAVRVLALAGMAALILSPRTSWRELGGDADALTSWFGDDFWWWSWRWREIFIGVPCLTRALFLALRRLECPDCENGRADPRPYFAAGLLAPIGLVTVLGRGGPPMSVALEQTFWAWLIGAVLGAVSLEAGRLVRRRRPKDLDHS